MTTSPSDRGWSWSRYQRPSALGTVWLAQLGGRIAIVQRDDAGWTAMEPTPGREHAGPVGRGATRKAALQDLLVETSNLKEPAP